MSLRIVARRALLGSFVVAAMAAVAGCGQMQVPNLGDVFIEQNVPTKVKRDHLGNPILPKG